LEKDLDILERNLKMRHHDAVRIVEPTEKQEKEEVAENDPKR
jgi:hypothetical protein